MNELIHIDDKAQEVATKIKEIEHAFLEIQQPRTDYVLERFVVGQHDTEPQRYAQCVLEMQIKYDNIRRAILNKKKLQLKIAKLEARNTDMSLISADLHKIDIEEQDRAMLGAIREFDALLKIFNSFPKKYNRKDLEDNQEEYWQKRLARQAQQEMIANGRVGAGNQEALRQIGLASTPKLDHIREIEKKYLESGDTKILIAVPTEKKAEEGLSCIKDLIYPSGVQIKQLNVFGREVAEAYNCAAQQACDDGADFMFCVEDDTFPPTEALHHLLELYRKSEGKTIVGGWYPKRNKIREGTPIILKAGKRQPLAADGDVHEVYTIPMGCTLIPTQVFFATEYPWFVTTPHLTQDSFFSQKARDAGYKLLVDTNLKCKHIDRVTGEVFE